MLTRLSRYGLLLALSTALLAPAARAQAPQKERVALHPCVITGGKKQKEVSELEAICATAAVRGAMELIPSTDVQAFLAKEARGSCARAKNRNACLGRLAAATQATRTLYITLNPFTPKSTRIAGLVVDEKGKKVEERSLELPRLASQSLNDVVRFSVSQLLDQLEVAKAPLPEVVPPPLTPEPEPEPIARPPPPPAPEPAPVVTARPEPPRERTWRTPVGLGGAVAGAAGLGLSAYLFSSANTKAREFNQAYAEGKLPPQTDLVRLDTLRDEARAQRTTATLASAAGAALLVGGGVLFTLDTLSVRAGPPSEKAGSARLMAGPGQVGLLVRLP